MQMQKIVGGTSISTRLNFSYFRCMKYDMISAALTSDSTTSMVSIKLRLQLLVGEENLEPRDGHQPNPNRQESRVLAGSRVTSFRIACVLMCALSGRPKFDRHQINHRENKHPDQIDEVPVQAAHLDVIGVETFRCRIPSP